MLESFWGYPTTSQISYEVTVAEAAAFIIFFAFIYYDTIVSYAIIQAIRGKGIWMSSIAAASEAPSPPLTPALPVARYTAVLGGQAPYTTYGDYSHNARLQLYNSYSAQPLDLQDYPASPWQILPPPGRYYPALSGNAPLSPQPNHTPYPAANQGQILPGGYQNSHTMGSAMRSSLKEVVVISATEDVYALVHERAGSFGLQVSHNRSWVSSSYDALVTCEGVVLRRARNSVRARDGVSRTIGHPVPLDRELGGLYKWPRECPRVSWQDVPHRQLEDRTRLPKLDTLDRYSGDKLSQRTHPHCLPHGLARSGPSLPRCSSLDDEVEWIFIGHPDSRDVRDEITRESACVILQTRFVDGHCRPGDRKLLPQKHIITADWSAFEQYASRVQVLGDMNSSLFGGIVVHAMIGFSSRSLLVLNLRGFRCGEGPHSFLHAYVAAWILASGRFACVWHLRKKSGIRSQQIPCLEVVETHATSPQVSELALYGFTHLQEVSPALFSNNALSCPRGLVGLQVLDIRIAVPLTRVKSQFRTFSLDTLIVHSFDLFLSGSLIEGWVILCRRPQLVSEHHGTAVQRSLRKMSVEFSGAHPTRRSICLRLREPGGGVAAAFEQPLSVAVVLVELEEGGLDQDARQTKWEEVPAYSGVLTLVRWQASRVAYVELDTAVTQD
ncbi:uncharacterized protein HD556DRAFT_1538151 [Suillus plorans]|uniref:Uncharacterized protein n=1 Tax=Suillus plorans TaxID=116603 RepID=A0A9P7AHS2_9AGAM|nr:uncharacterized protein HD556DRAFT_1538151 [Suillus plorans]KAG1789624.1 hypothetical protein HD556DRAFT_1538151 [Suillus plorans]